ncbi:MAG: hypothetical protein ACRDJN_09550 [Chloroflexota bacterium]
MSAKDAGGSARVDEFLTGYIVRTGLCLNYEVTDRIRLGSTDEVCAGPACPQRRLCLSRSLRRHLDDVPSNAWLRQVFDEALQEMGNGP